MEDETESDLTEILFDLVDIVDAEYVEPCDLIEPEEIEKVPLSPSKYHKMPYEKNVNNYDIPFGVTVEEMQHIIWNQYRPKVYHSNLTKEKISIANTGVKHTPKTKERISASLSNRRLSDDHRERISQSMKGKPRKPMSEETKRKISEAKKSKKEPADKEK